MESQRCVIHFIRPKPSLRGSDATEAISSAMAKQFYVYIMTNKDNTVLYTGVTSDLKGRVYRHREKLVEGFTRRYNATKLVWFEVFEDAYNAIAMEKRIKAGSRQRKIDLINGANAAWRDLYDEL